MAVGCEQTRPDVNDDAEPRQRPPQRRAITLDEIDLDGFLAAAETANSISDLTTAFLARVRGAGFTRAFYVQVISNFERVTVVKGERLLDGQGPLPLAPTPLVYFDSDPAMTHKLAHLQPYSWIELARDYELNADIKDRLAEYRDAGFVDGVSVPVSLHEGDLAAFAFVQPHTVFTLSKPALRKLQFFCQAMHERYATLDPAQAEGKLSKRETQVMTRIAVGKTNAKIAAELGISVHTVNTLVRRCFLKLGVSNRVEAAARMAYLGRRG